MGREGHKKQSGKPTVHIACEAKPARRRFKGRSKRLQSIICIILNENRNRPAEPEV
jgi:hypothetical protein